MPRIFQGETLKDYRKAKKPKMRQEDLAAAVQRNRLTISNIERGALQPSFDLAVLLAKAVDVDDVQKLYRVIRDQDDEIPLPPDERRLIQALREMPPILKSHVIAFVIGLTGTEAADLERAADLWRAKRR